MRRLKAGGIGNGYEVTAYPAGRPRRWRGRRSEQPCVGTIRAQEPRRQGTRRTRFLVRSGRGGIQRRLELDSEFGVASPSAGILSRLAPPPSTSGMRRHWRTSRPFRICRASTLSARAWKEASGVRSFAKLSMLAPTAFRRHARPRSSTSRRRSGSRCPARPMRRRFAPTRSSVTRCFRVTAQT